MHTSSNKVRPLRSLFLISAAIALLQAASYAQEPTPPAPPLNRFTGRVWTPNKEAPVPNATVAVVDVKEGFLMYGGPTEVFVHAPEEKVLLFFTKANESRSATVFTDSEGRFVIQGLKPGKYHVLVVHSERGMAIVRDVEQPNTGDGLEAILEPPTFLEGSIHGLNASTTPIMGGLGRRQDSITRDGFESGFPTMMMFNPRFSIASDGSFHVGPVPSSGEWTLSLSQPVARRNFLVTVLKLPVTLSAGASNKFEFDFTKGAQVVGQVVGPTGEPLAEAAVSVCTPDSDEPSGHEYGALTGSDGRFLLSGIPDGTYELKANRWLPRTGVG